MRLFEGTPFDIPPKCDRCGNLEAECTCREEDKLPLPPEKQTARLAVEKRKKGKVVTVVRGLVAGKYLDPLLTKLQSACGAGGTCDEGVLEIQGNHLERIAQALSAMGYNVKR